LFVHVISSLNSWVECRSPIMQTWHTVHFLSNFTVTVSMLKDKASFVQTLSSNKARCNCCVCQQERIELFQTRTLI